MEKVDMLVDMDMEQVYIAWAHAGVIPLYLAWKHICTCNSRIAAQHDEES